MPFGFHSPARKPVTTGVTLWVQSAPGDDPLVLTYEVVDPPADHDLVVVLVERDLEHEITGGECAGMTLHHDNSMREYHVIPDATTGELTLPWAADQVWENSTVIGWIQEEGTLHVVGGKESGWVRRIGEESPVEMRLGDDTYALTASAVTEGWQQILEAYVAKYQPDYPDIVAGFPTLEEAEGQVAVFRLNRE